MKRGLAFILSLFICLGAIMCMAEEKKDSVIGVESRATAYIIGDFKSGQILEKYNIDQPLSMASVSKLMTYLVVKDAISEGKIKLEDSLTVTKDMAEIEGSSFMLKEGESLTVDQLLKGLMVVSGNDAAYALGVKVAGSEEEFVKLMNQTAKDLSFEKAAFYNASGLQAGENQNTMTTREVFLLARHIIEKYPEVLEYSEIRSLNMPERNFNHESTIPLVGEMPGVDGLKTGFTEEAGYCLVSTMDVAKSSRREDYRLITVAMGTSSIEERRDVSKYLLEYGSENYSIRTIVDSSAVYKNIKLSSAATEEIHLYPSEDFKALSKKENGFVIKETYDKNIKAPIDKDTKLGELTILKDGQEVKKIDLLVKNKVETASFSIRLIRMFENLFSNIGMLLK